MGYYFDDLRNDFGERVARIVEAVAPLGFWSKVIIWAFLLSVRAAEAALFVPLRLGLPGPRYRPTGPFSAQRAACAAHGRPFVRFQPLRFRSRRLAALNGLLGFLRKAGHELGLRAFVSTDTQFLKRGSFGKGVCGGDSLACPVFCESG